MLEFSFTPTADLADLAAAQHGVFTASQARQLGTPIRSLRNRAARGFYTEYPGAVFTVAGSPPTWKQKLVKAVLSEGGLAAGSHETAACIHGLIDRRGRFLHIVTTRWLRRPRQGVKVHESLDLIPPDIEVIDGIPTTTAARTLVDLGATHPWLVRGALGSAVRSGKTSLVELEQLIARVARRGRRGVGVIRPLLEERRLRAGRTESELEDRFIAVISEFGLPIPTAQFVVLDDEGDFISRADFAYPDRRVLIELDGFRYHSAGGAFQQDRFKQNRALLLGWRILRYTWHDVTERAAAIAAEIHTVLAL